MNHVESRALNHGEKLPPRDAKQLVDAWFVETYNPVAVDINLRDTLLSRSADQRRCRARILRDIDLSEANPLLSKIIACPCAPGARRADVEHDAMSGLGVLIV